MTVGVILAGGESRRMGGQDKSFVVWRDRALIAHVIDRMRPQVDQLAICLHEDDTQYHRFNLPIIIDPDGDRIGPAAGLLSALSWAHGQKAEYVQLVANDMPLIPVDLVARLGEGQSAGLSDTEAGLPTAPEVDGHLQPITGLWPVSQRTAIDKMVTQEDQRAMWRLFQGLNGLAIPFTDPDAFTNFNAASDLDP